MIGYLIEGDFVRDVPHLSIDSSRCWLHRLGVFDRLAEVESE